MPCIASFVGEQAFWGADGVEQRLGQGDVGDISWRQGDGDRSAAMKRLSFPLQFWRGPP